VCFASAGADRPKCGICGTCLKKKGKRKKKLFSERRSFVFRGSGCALYERALVLWIREQSAYCQDPNSNKGGGGATPKDVATCGGSAWFTGGPTEVVAKAV
jgi:hypothetical protein